MKHRNLITLLIAVTTTAVCACNSTPPSTPAGPSPTPHVAAASPATAAQNPCFVHIWEDENFEDDNDVIFGPGRWNNMRNLPGANKNDWGDEIDSLKVGPAATVTVWEDENFGDNSQTYGPGTEKTNLRGNPDMGDQIDSMEIKCQ